MSVGAVNKETGERIPTAGMPAIDSVLSGTSTNPVQNRVVKAALDEKTDTDIVASDFSAATSYTAGAYCIYEGKFYRFKNNHTGGWSASDVDEIKIAGELSSLMSGLTGVTNVPLSAITLARGLTLDPEKGSALYSRTGRLYGVLHFTGFITINANGAVNIGSIAAPYRPIVRTAIPAYINGATSLALAIITVMPSGYIALIGEPGNYGKGDGTGDDSWDTADGIYIEFAINM